MRGDGARPVQPVVRPVAPAARGDDVGQYAVGLLFVAVVGQPLLVDRDCVVVVEGRLDGQVAVARPAVLLALRTVGRVTHQVREVGFVRGLPQLLDEPLRRADLSRGSHVAVLEPCREVCRGELHRAVGDHLHVAESLVVEAGHELVVAAAERHYVGLEEVLGIGRAEVDIDVREVGVTVFAEPFGVDQPEPRAGLAPHAELRHAGHVLSGSHRGSRCR